MYVLFCCQQAVEKMLKSLVAAKTGEFRPRLHHLGRLAVAAGIEVDDAMGDLLGELTAYTSSRATLKRSKRWASR